jgi:hypothetical protein
VISDASISLSAGLPETVLPPPPPDWMEALRVALGGSSVEPAEPDALDASDAHQLASAVAEVARDHPTCLEAWATLAELSLARGDDVSAYAFARVGYHRGLDALRAAGWRGSGYVRWSEPTNCGFLRSLDALRLAAGAIGEGDEEERCRMFLRQLDPAGLPTDS